MRPQVPVLVFGLGLWLAPIAVQYVLPSVDQPPRLGNGAFVDRVVGHGLPAEAAPPEVAQEEQDNQDDHDDPYQAHEAFLPRVLGELFLTGTTVARSEPNPLRSPAC